MFLVIKTGNAIRINHLNPNGILMSHESWVMGHESWVMVDVLPINS